MRILGLIMLVTGILAIAYGGFWYATEETKAEIGPVTVKVEERERVNVPLWAGVATVAVGVILLAQRPRQPA